VRSVMNCRECVSVCVCVCVWSNDSSRFNCSYFLQELQLQIQTKSTATHTRDNMKFQNDELTLGLSFDRDQYHPTSLCFISAGVNTWIYVFLTSVLVDGGYR
jgi:hypothetical protein